MSMISGILAFVMFGTMLVSCSGGASAPGGTETETGAEAEAETETEKAAYSMSAESMKIDGTEWSYLFYAPETEPSEKLPMIVYLHGGSGKGKDLSLLTSADGFPAYLNDGKIAPECYVVIPQLDGYKGWNEAGDKVMKLISTLEGEYMIDPDRVSLTGHSMGGTGVWSLALAYPGSFSAIAPLSGSVLTNELNLKKLSGLPVYAVVGGSDTIVPPESSEKFISALGKTNPDARIEVIEGADHFAVPAAYLDEELGIVDWLLSESE